MADDGEAPVLFKKKSNKNRPQARKRTLAEDGGAGESSAAGPSEVVKKEKRLGNNFLIQATVGAASKRRKVEEASSDEDDVGPHKALVSYGAQGSARLVAGARRSVSPSDDPKGLHPALADLPPDGAGADDGLYKGASALKHQLPKGGARFGPVKGPANVRTITITDFQPDVCKDYKETGFCGFGDTCKFLHDRGDYMHGWQLDNAFAASRNGGKTAADAEDEEEEEVPFACLICRKPFTDPVVTKCGHYFCSACAIKRFAKNPKCFACGAPTSGIFNKASKILEKMRLKQEAAAAAKAAKEADDNALAGIEGLEDLGGAPAEPEEEVPMYGEREASGSERSFYEDE